MEIGEAVGRYEQAAELLPAGGSRRRGACRTTVRRWQRNSGCGRTAYDHSDV